MLSERREDDVEGVGAFEASCVDGGSHVRFGFGGPHCAVAVGDLSLDDAGAEFALLRVVCRVDLVGIVAKGEKLVSRASDFGL